MPPPQWWCWQRPWDCDRRQYRAATCALQRARCRAVSGLSQALSRSGQPAGEGAINGRWAKLVRVAMSASRSASAPSARSTETTYSCGMSSFGRSIDHDSGSAINASARALRSPCVCKNTAVSLSTAAAGGSSRMKWRANLVAMWRAVAGCVASQASAALPSSTPFSA